MKLSFHSFLVAAVSGIGRATAEIEFPFPLSDAVAKSDANTKQNVPFHGLRMQSGAAAGSCGSAPELKDDMAPPRSSMVYVQSNEVDNTILTYSRNTRTGKLTYAGPVATGGRGVRAVLAPGSIPGPNSTGSIKVAGRCLLATNAGDDTVSTFRISPGGELELQGAFPTDGPHPLSVAERDGLVYVLNAGEQGSIRGFNLDAGSCNLSPVGEPVPLRQTTPPEDPFVYNTPFFLTSPHQIGFTPAGELAVTIKVNDGKGGFNRALDGEDAPGSLNIYTIGDDGTTSDDALNQILLDDGASVTFVFAFDFSGAGNLILVEAVGEGMDAGDGGSVIVFDDDYNISERIQVGQVGTCWVKYVPQSGCVFTSNTGSDPNEPIVNSISSVTLNPLTLKESIQASAFRPVDLEVSRDGYYLYVLSSIPEDGSAPPHINVFKTDCSCGLRNEQIIDEGFLGDGQVAEYGLAIYEEAGEGMAPP